MRLAVVLAILLAVSPSRADTTYRVALGTTTVVSGAMLMSCVEIGGKPCMITAPAGLAGLVLAAPVIHLGYEHPGRALASLGTHVVVPLLGAGAAIRFFGAAERGSFWGLTAGFVVATAIDIAIATDDEPPAKRMFSIGGSF